MEKGKNPKQVAIEALAKRALAMIIAMYIVILVIDMIFEPSYKGWMVASFTVCGLLFGIGLGFIIAYKIRFSTVMKSRSDGEIMSDIRQHKTPKTGGFGLDDKE